MVRTGDMARTVRGCSCRGERALTVWRGESGPIIRDGACRGEACRGELAVASCRGENVTCMAPSNNSVFDSGGNDSPCTLSAACKLPKPAPLRTSGVVGTLGSEDEVGMRSV